MSDNFDENCNENYNDSLFEEAVRPGSFFSFEGTCTIKRYWKNKLITYLVLIGLFAVYTLLSDYLSYEVNVAFIIFLSILTMFALIHLLCIRVQRLRAAAYNPWTIFIPIFNGIVSGFFSSKLYAENKFITYTIPCKKLFMVLQMIWLLGTTGSEYYKSYESIANDKPEFESISKTLFEDDACSIIKMNSESGKSYYVNIFTDDSIVFDTVIFREAQTLKFFKKMRKTFEKKYGSEYGEKLHEFINYLTPYSPSIVLYDEDYDVIETFLPEEWSMKTLTDCIEDYNPAAVRVCHNCFDEIIENLIEEEKNKGDDFFRI